MSDFELMLLARKTAFAMIGETGSKKEALIVEALRDALADSRAEISRLNSTVAELQGTVRQCATYFDDVDGLMEYDKLRAAIDATLQGPLAAPTPSQTDAGESAAKAAFEAYVPLDYKDYTPPKWEFLPQYLREAWQAAVSSALPNAVISAETESGQGALDVVLDTLNVSLKRGESLDVELAQLRSTVSEQGREIAGLREGADVWKEMFERRCEHHESERGRLALSLVEAQREIERLKLVQPTQAVGSSDSAADDWQRWPDEDSGEYPPDETDVLIFEAWGALGTVHSGERISIGRISKQRGTYGPSHAKFWKHIDRSAITHAWNADNPAALTTKEPKVENDPTLHELYDVWKQEPK